MMNEEQFKIIKARLANEYDDYQEYYEDSEDDMSGMYRRCLEQAMKDLRALIEYIESTHNTPLPPGGAIRMPDEYKIEITEDGKLKQRFIRPDE